MDKTLSAVYQSLCVLSAISCVHGVILKSCPIWHIPIQDHSGHTECVCSDKLRSIVKCNGDLLSIRYGYCLTWNNSTNSAEIHRCLLDYWDRNSFVCIRHYSSVYHLPVNISGMELDYVTCQKLNNRQGSLCERCIDGYGPALFSNSISCADCSKNRNLWILNVLFQLSMVTLLCLVIILLQIKGASSPLNVIITYSQICAVGLKIGDVTRSRLVCYFGRVFVVSVKTVIDVLNLDFFRALIPPLCISQSTNAINSLLFDYLVAFYPLIFTVFIYISIELYDRNIKLFVLLSYPIRKCMAIFRTSWDPRRTILNTFVTFFLLSYSKLLFVSVNLLIASQSRNSRGERVPNTIVLLYDPSTRFFHSEHIPYAIFALLVIVLFILLPPLLLVLYPTRLFRWSLLHLRFHRWDILHHVMDVFQGWYKDGTEGTRDFRCFSALYLFLRVGFSCLLVTVLMAPATDRYHYILLVFGVVHVFLGVTVLIIKPHRKSWMSNADGIIFTLLGSIFLLVSLSSMYMYMYIMAAVITPLVLTLTFLYVACKFVKEHKLHVC